MTLHESYLIDGTQAIPALNQLRAGEAYELGGLGFDVHLERPFRHHKITVHKSGPRYFYCPQEAAADYVGRETMFQTVYDAFFPMGEPIACAKRKSFVVFGMGGSGKTQFCSKYAQDNRDRYR